MSAGDYVRIEGGRWTICDRSVATHQYLGGGRFVLIGGK